MYNVTVDDLRMDWGELDRRAIMQADRAFYMSDCYLDNLTGAQLQYLVDKHGHMPIIDRLRPFRDDDEGLLLTK